MNSSDTDYTTQKIHD